MQTIMPARNIIIAVVALVLLLLRLRKDFKRDPGFHKRSKTYHGIILSVLVFFIANSVYYFFWVLLNFESVASGYSMYTGDLPGSLQFALYLLKLICTVTVFVLCFLMAGRNESARKLFFYALPLLCLCTLANYYTNALAFGNAVDTALPNVTLIVSVIYAGLMFLTLMIYKSPFMKTFFIQNTRSNENGDDGILDDITISEES